MVVLPVPGTSSSRICPSQSSAISKRSVIASLPNSTEPIALLSLDATSRSPESAGSPPTATVFTANSGATLTPLSQLHPPQRTAKDGQEEWPDLVKEKKLG